MTVVEELKARLQSWEKWLMVKGRSSAGQIVGRGLWGAVDLGSAGVYLVSQVAMQVVLPVEADP